MLMGLEAASSNFFRYTGSLCARADAVNTGANNELALLKLLLLLLVLLELLLETGAAALAIWPAVLLSVLLLLILPLLLLRFWLPSLLGFLLGC
jgi:hypothetical protein